MSTDPLLHEWRRDAPEEARGRIRVDAQRAIEKLRDYRLPEPELYVLELLRAAVASGAEVVEMRTDADDTEISFDGTPFGTDVLENLWGHALAGGSDRDSVRYRLLALGVLGALALRPRFVDVESGRAAVRVTPPSRIKTTSPRGRTGGTRIHVREGAGWRVLRDAVKGSREAAIARERTPRFPARLTIDGAPVPKATFPGSSLAWRERTSAGRRICVWAVDRAATSWTSELSVAVHGVTVARRTLPLPGLDLVGFVDDGGLLRNASGTDLVDGDPAWNEIVAELQRLVDGMLGELLGRAERKEVRTALQRAAARLVAGGPGASPADAEIVRRLRHAPLLPGPAGEWVSLDALDAERRAGRLVRIARRGYPRELYTPPVVLVEGLDHHAKLLVPPGPWRDVDDEIQARRLAAAARERFLGLPQEPARLLDVPHAFRGSMGPDITGEVALSPDFEGAEMRILHRGRFLEQRREPLLQPLRLRAVVGASCIEPDPTYTSARGDEGYAAVVAAVRSTALEVVRQAVAAPQPWKRGVVEMARDVLQAVPLAAIPAELQEAPIFALAGGGSASLASILARPLITYADRPFPDPALDGTPVVVLERGEELRLLIRLVSRNRLVDATARLTAEAKIRRRMNAPRRVAKLQPWVRFAQPVGGEGIVAGEAGLQGGVVPDAARVTLLREGVPLEESSIAELPRGTVAVVDVPSLQPSPSWEAAVRDAAFGRTIAAIRATAVAILREILAARPDQPLTARSAIERAFAADLLGGVLAEVAGAAKAAGADAASAGARALELPLLPSSRGILSLSAIREAARAAGRLWIADAIPAEVPADMLVIVATADLLPLLRAATGLLEESPDVELGRRAARARFEALAPHPSLPAAVALVTEVVRGGLSGGLGYLPGGDPGVVADVVVRDRLYRSESAPARLPARARIVAPPELDPASPELPDDVRRDLVAILAESDRAIVAQALRRTEEPAAREALHAAIAAGLDASHPEIAQVLLYATTAGARVSLADLAARARVFYVTAELAGDLRYEQHVVLAVEPGVLPSLARFRWRLTDVTTPFREELRASQSREQAPEQLVAVEGQVLRRRSVRTDAVEGEVAFVHGPGQTIRLFRSRRLVAREPWSVPPGVAGAMGSEALTPFVGLKGVKHDRVHRALLSQARSAVEALAADVASEWSGLTPGERGLLTPVMARVAGWLAKRRRTKHAALALPLYMRTDGGFVSMAEMLGARSLWGKVLVSRRRGALLDPARWVYCPREGEREHVEAVVPLTDATLELDRDARIGKMPVVATVEVPLVTPWREPLAPPPTTEGEVPESPLLEGEIALPRSPCSALLIELLWQRRPLCKLELPHPLGGVVRCNSSATEPPDVAQPDVRLALNAAIGRLCERALERLALRMLHDGERGDWGPHATGLLRWKGRADDAIGRALAALPLFRDSADRPVTVGRVFAEARRRGRLPIVGREAPPAAIDEPLVLRCGSEERTQLELLAVPTESGTDVLAGALARQRRDAARRIEALAVPGPKLASIAVEEGAPPATPGWRGELALTGDPRARIVLCKGGVMLEGDPAPGLRIAGMLEHPDLPVEEGMLGRLPPALAAELEALVERLLQSFAASEVPPALRHAAVPHVLHHVARRGVTSAALLDRIDGAAGALARMRVFPLADGRWLDLRAIAARVVRHGSIPVAPRGFAPPGTMEPLLSIGESPVLEALAAVLGSRALAPVADARAWEAHLREREPETGTPLHRGLAKLRHEADLLYGIAGGRLSRNDLAEIRLLRGSGRDLVTYDGATAIAHVDAHHEGVKRALEGGGEGIHVLVAAIYGAVNRALARVTDEDEAQALVALLEHLSACPPAGG